MSNELTPQNLRGQHSRYRLFSGLCELSRDPANVGFCASGLKAFGIETSQNERHNLYQSFCFSPVKRNSLLQNPNSPKDRTHAQEASDYVLATPLDLQWSTTGRTSLAFRMITAQLNRNTIRFAL